MATSLMDLSRFILNEFSPWGKRPASAHPYLYIGKVEGGRKSHPQYDWVDTRADSHFRVVFGPGSWEFLVHHNEGSQPTVKQVYSYILNKGRWT